MEQPTLEDLCTFLDQIKDAVQEAFRSNKPNDQEISIDLLNALQDCIQELVPPRSDFGAEPDALPDPFIAVQIGYLDPDRS